MIYKGIEIFNVSHLETDENGVTTTLRVPPYADEKLTEQGKLMNRGSTGVELRFLLHSDEVRIKLRSLAPNISQHVTLLYGDINSDWPESALNKTVSNEVSEIIVRRPNTINSLRKIAEKYNHRFSPDVFRILAPAGGFEIIDVEGDVTPPTSEYLPNRKYLAYGSSITHGSIAVYQENCYASHIGRHFSADTQNLGFAGSAGLEKEVAEFIANECEFDFATLEMGINILDVGPVEYEHRVRKFVPIIANGHPNSTIFATDVYYCISDMDENDGRAAKYREIVERVLTELNLPNVKYINGLKLLDSEEHLAAGLIHPTPSGQNLIAKNFIKFMERELILN